MFLASRLDALALDAGLWLGDVSFAYMAVPTRLASEVARAACRAGGFAGYAALRHAAGLSHRRGGVSSPFVLALFSVSVIVLFSSVLVLFFRFSFNKCDAGQGGRPHKGPARCRHG
jgi:hypothetical protein